MKISKSEKLLLSLLICVLVGIGYYDIIFKMETSKISELKAERDTQSSRLDNIKSQIARAGTLSKTTKELNEKVQSRVGRIYPVLNQDKLILELDSIYKSSNVEGNITFQDTTNSNSTNNSSSGSSTNSQSKQDNTKQIAELQKLVDKYNSQILTGKSSAQVSASTVNSMKANITFSGSYDGVMTFLKNIEGNEKLIAISGLTLSSGGSLINGTATLEFYSIPKFADMDQDYLKWNSNGQYGKQNPFAGTVSSNATIQQAAVAQKDDKDFAMAVRSVNSDLPAIMLGKYGDEQRTTYVYDDKNSVENVNITVTETNGKFYYKYTAGSDSYPKQASGNGEEFTPVGNDISIIIYSSKRSSNTDNTGINLNVNNKTSRVVNVTVVNDDGNQPRISVKGQGNAVQTKNQ